LAQPVWAGLNRSNDMNLVKWFRKNNKKVMAVVVIVIMFGFIGGGALRQLGRRRTGTIAYFGAKNKITDYDLAMARQELDILGMLRADALLRSQDLHGIFLGELLFSDQRASVALINRLKQTIRTNQYQISEKQINDLYRRQAPPAIHWLLLQNEAQNAGIRISNEQAGELLGRIIPQLFQGQTYKQLIGAIITQQRIPEQQVLTTVAKLLAIMQYSAIVCSNEDLTTRQIMQMASNEEERISVEFVKFDSAVFAEQQEAPGEEKIAEHFNKYKAIAPGTVSDENPHGFGYKLPDRVQLEYIAVKLDEVKTIVKRPTQDEMGTYYSRNKTQLFTEQVPSDPNDPNSPTIPKTKSFAEVANSISQQLLKDKISATATNILQEARTLTEAGLEDLKIESAEVTTEQLKENEKVIGERLSRALKKERLEERIIGPCPICKNGQLVILRSRISGKRFVGCTNYFEGTCKTSFPLPQKGLAKPTGNVCRSCGWNTVRIWLKGNRPWNLCINPLCSTKKKVEKR